MELQKQYVGSSKERSKLVESLRNEIKIGDQITLIEMVGEKNMPSGLKGTVRCIDDVANIHVNWENGSSLAVVPTVDKYQIHSKSCN